MRLDPQLPSPHYNRGNVYEQRGEFDRAVADYDQANLDPKFAVAFKNRGFTYHQKTDYDRAIQDYDSAIQLDPGYERRGLAREAKGDREGAKGDFEAALPLPAQSKDGEWVIEMAQNRLAALLAPPAAASPAPGRTETVAAVSTKPTSTERRVALAIGNSGYQAVSALPNPKNDANGVAEALKSGGFTSVQVLADATHDAMIQALRAFESEADRADWGVAYYAGHGMEIGGVNYLMPVDGSRWSRIQDEAISLNRVLDAVAGSKKLKLVLLDACRENPFARQMRRTIASRGISRGLTTIQPEGATVVVYAAKDGEVAEDGQGDHSPFTAALIKRLQQPDVEINKLFRLVTGDVLQATGNHQRPFVYGSIPGEEDFFFNAR